MKKVFFNAQEHIYTNEDGKVLMGITSLLKKHLFEKKYDAVPEKVLMNASDRGKNIHYTLEQFEECGLILDEKLIKNWIVFKELNKIHIYHTEMLVSDGENFASMIDAVGLIGDLDAFFDYKTTYVLDKQYLSWQLSIYAHLLKDIHSKLYAIHIDKDYNFKLVEIDRIPSNKIVELFNAEINGELYVNDSIAKINTEALLLLEQTYVDMKAQMDELDEKRKTLMELVRKQMIEENVKSFEVNETTFTNVEDTLSKTFDSTKFKKDYPEMAENYMKESFRKGYLKITIKK